MTVPTVAVFRGTGFLRRDSPPGVSGIWLAGNCFSIEWKSHRMEKAVDGTPSRCAIAEQAVVGALESRMPNPHEEQR